MNSQSKFKNTALRGQLSVVICQRKMIEQVRPLPKYRGRSIIWEQPPGMIVMSTNNPRYHNGAQRRKYRARFKAMNAPCGICAGRFGEIHYDEPSDSAHPLSFVIDEIHPVSRWREFGYPSPEAACADWNNLQAAHYCCNAAKSNKTDTTPRLIKRRVNLPDGTW